MKLRQCKSFRCSSAIQLQIKFLKSRKKKVTLQCNSMKVSCECQSERTPYTLYRYFSSLLSMLHSFASSSEWLCQWILESFYLILFSFILFTNILFLIKFKTNFCSSASSSSSPPPFIHSSAYTISHSVIWVEFSWVGGASMRSSASCSSSSSYYFQYYFAIELMLTWCKMQ